MAKKKSSPSVSFETYLVLFRYFLGEIGTTELKSLGNKLNNVEYEWQYSFSSLHSSDSKDETL